MWYKWKNDLYNINKIEKICKFNSHNQLYFVTDSGQYDIFYPTEVERDAEFEKICKMLGLGEPEHISRCC